MNKILMVCMGNICRSPLAEGVLRAQVTEQGRESGYVIDSAGTHGHYHAGEPPDPRAIAAAVRRGYMQVAQQRARPIHPDDFERFDLIVAMDRDNLTHLKRMCPPEHQGKLYLLLTFAPELALDELPDPYFGNAEGFERVLNLCEAGVRGMLARLTKI